MATETRWPAFARRAAAAGVNSSLTVALPLQEAIAIAHLYTITATLADNMRRVMETRAVIEQAKGIIAQQHCTPEHAFELLTRLSQSRCAGSTWPAPAARPRTAR